MKKRKGGVALPWQVLFNGLGKLFRVVRLWCFGVAPAGGGISHKIRYATLFCIGSQPLALLDETWDYYSSGNSNYEYDYKTLSGSLSQSFFTPSHAVNLIM